MAEEALSSPVGTAAAAGKRAADGESSNSKRQCVDGGGDMCTGGGDMCAFAIPSGKVFTIARAALQCKPLHESLLSRLVESSLDTSRDRNGAIQIGFECSSAAFCRVVDEFSWALEIKTHNERLGGNRYNRCGPPLRSAVHPRELAALWDYLGLPKMDHESRYHPNTMPRVLVEQKALQQGMKLMDELQCLIAAVSTLDMDCDDGLMVHATVATPAFYSIALHKPERDESHFTSCLFSLLQRPAAVKELCRVHGHPALADQLRIRPCTADDMSKIECGEMSIGWPKLGLSPSSSFRDLVPEEMDVTSRPLGCFAIGVRREYFYRNMSYHEAIEGYNRYLVDIPLPVGTFTLELDFRAHEAWTTTHVNTCHDVEITARVACSPATEGPPPAFILKLCKMNCSVADDPVSIELQQTIRQTFFKDTHNRVSKLLDYESLPESIETTAVVSEDVLMALPWAGRAGSGTGLEAALVGEVGFDVSDETEKQRSKIDPRNAGTDKLGGEDGWGFVSFIFTVSEARMTPALQVEEPGEGNEGLEVDKLLVLEISG